MNGIRINICAVWPTGAILLLESSLCACICKSTNCFLSCPAYSGWRHQQEAGMCVCCIRLWPGRWGWTVMLNMLVGGDLSKRQTSSDSTQRQVRVLVAVCPEEVCDETQCVRSWGVCWKPIGWSLRDRTQTDILSIRTDWHALQMIIMSKRKTRTACSMCYILWNSQWYICHIQASLSSHSHWM